MRAGGLLGCAAQADTVSRGSRCRPRQAPACELYSPDFMLRNLKNFVVSSISCQGLWSGACGDSGSPRTGRCAQCCPPVWRLGDPRVAPKEGVQWPPAEGALQRSYPRALGLHSQAGDLWGGLTRFCGDSQRCGVFSVDPDGCERQGRLAAPACASLPDGERR